MEQPEQVTGFKKVDDAGDPGFFVQFVDAMNDLEDIKSVKRIIRDELRLVPGLSVIEVGCGAGDDVRRIAAIVGGNGRVVGVDNSAVLIEEARRRAAGERLPVEFVQGDAQHLDFPDASFDRCRAERLFMYIAVPGQVLEEMVRVLRPGGRVVVFDFDWDMTYVDNPMRETTRRIVQTLSDVFPHGWIGRSLPRLFREAGLTDVRCIPHVVRPTYQITHWLLDGHLANQQAAGAFSHEEITRWWKYLDEAEAAGGVGNGCLGFVVAGTKR